MTYEYGSSLEDIVGSHPENLRLWKSNKVTRGGILTALYTKYWGPGKKSMKDEEVEWKSLGVTTMDVDDIDSDGDSDIIDGCYVLDFGLEGISPSKIWVRADYIRIYDELEIWLNDKPREKAPGAIVVGQPGKSIWIYYALRRRLGEQKPVIWCYGEMCYLFVAEGVYKKPADFIAPDFNKLVWTLVDERVPTPLVVQGTRLFVIFATSPNRERWKELSKSTRFTMCIMNPWTRQEMHQLVSMAGLNLDDTSTIYDTFGPTPRLWIDHSDPIVKDRYESDLRGMIDVMTTSTFEQYINHTKSFTMDSDTASHKLYLIRRVDSHPRSLYTVGPITPNVQSMLANHFQFMERLDLIRLYQKFEKNPDSRKVAGILFEAIGQQSLQEKITLVIVPMVRFDKVPTGKPRWHSSHISLESAVLEAKRLEALQHSIHLDVKPTRVVQSGVTSPSVEEGVYYVPEKTNQVAIDSFIVSDGLLYLFQFTIGEHHDVKAGLKTFLKTYPSIPAEDNWHFVFIIPTNKELISPQLPDSLKKLRVSSATIDVDIGVNRKFILHK